jgi:acid stress-induced BolA-like protein IbaG/YrbA
MDPAEIKRRIEQAIPDSTASVVDTGGGNHFQAMVISRGFEGKTMVEQHRMVYEALRAALDSETIHAMALQTFTPEEHGRRG